MQGSAHPKNPLRWEPRNSSKKESLFSWALAFLCLHMFVREGICYQHAKQISCCIAKLFFGLM